MAEELDIPSLLKQLEPFELSPIERVLAGHTGTVQVLLSLWFNQPVVVDVTSQEVTGAGITREVKLVLQRSGLAVAWAHSIIPRASNLPKIMEDVEEQNLGLGQIAVKHQIPTSRQITELDATDLAIRRKYVMEGQGLRYVITEQFDRTLYRQDPAAVLEASDGSGVRAE